MNSVSKYRKTLLKKQHVNKYITFSRAEENLKTTTKRIHILTKGCTTKAKYKDEATIEKQIKKLLVKEKKQLYYYRCELCNKLHLTSKKPVNKDLEVKKEQ
jgi:hypothetical protein